uniref:DUF148 domain-containing protein n=1 Tax=Steinernema glaseri TaxID=37863 RepID=A0A1I8AI20_9BILA
MHLYSFLLLSFVSLQVVLCEKYTGNALIFEFLQLVLDLSKEQLVDVGDEKDKIFVDNADIVIAKIRTVNPAAAGRLKKFHDEVYEKLNKLSDKAKKFVVQTMSDMMSVHNLKPYKAECYKRCMIVLLAHIKEARGKSDMMKEIGAVFDNIKDYWEDPNVQKFLDENLNRDPREVVDELEPDVKDRRRKMM